MNNINALSKTQLHPIVTKFKTVTTIIILTVIALLFLPWQQTTRGEGLLIPYNPAERDYTILAPISGLVSKYYIEEDKEVKKGDLLFEMIDLDAEYANKLLSIMSDVEKRKTNLQESIALMSEREKNMETNLETRLAIFDNKIRQTEDTLKVLHQELELQKHNYQLTKSHEKRISKLHKDGLESTRSLELSENSALQAEIALNNLKTRIEQEKTELAIVKQEKSYVKKSETNAIHLLQNTILDAKSQLNQLEQELKRHSIELSRNKTSQLFASRDGIPMRILKNDTNLYINKGEKLVHFAPKVTKRALLLKVRTLDMPLIKKGLPVRVQFHGWPSLQVSGWPLIKFGTFGGIIDKIDPITHEDGIFYAYVVEDPKEPWPEIDTLKVGTQASGWVLMDTVSIWYEIWRMHNAIPPKMIEPSSATLEAI